MSSDVSGRRAELHGADNWVRKLFDRIDAKDTESWLAYLSDDARFRFGNAPPLAGKEAIREGVNAFLASLSAVEHDIGEIWTLGHTVICRGEVRYTRPDGSTLTIPFANIFKLDENGLVRDYLIYADISGL